jgi:hypothetical protein
MVVKCAAEAEAVFAPAMDRGHNTIEFALLDTTFDRIDALWCWTPLQALFIVHIGPRKQDFVAVFDFLSHQQLQ